MTKTVALQAWPSPSPPRCTWWLWRKPLNPGSRPSPEAPAANNPRPHPEIAFMRADANGDGKLSKAEAVRLPAVASKFDALDKDKDGMLSMGE